MFELIKKARLEVDYFLKRRALEKQKDRDYKILRNRKQFEVDKEELQNEVQLEGLKANANAGSPLTTNFLPPVLKDFVTGLKAKPTS